MNQQAVDCLATLTAELGQVEQEVRAALDDLQAPFSQLVQSQLAGSFPLLRAAFVLAGGMDAEDSARLAHERVVLGAAIEVLRLALAVHTRLLGGASEPYAQVDRSLLGSTVLAGDFCFSRAAGLAAQTGSPVVVDIFAQALQRVSEGTLRGLFLPGQGPFDVDRELCLSGVAAANELTGLDEQEQQADQQVAAQLLDSWQAGTLGHLMQLPAGTLSPQREERWHALLTWLRSNE